MPFSYEQKTYLSIYINNKINLLVNKISNQNHIVESSKEIPSDLESKNKYISDTILEFRKIKSELDSSRETTPHIERLLQKYSSFV